MQLRATPERDPGSVAALLNDPRATGRAAKALRCLPFRRAFYPEPWLPSGWKPFGFG